ncbi:MAG: hypothetical protein HYZ44_01885 [Bacteroidetes bacterium]|nr:hypothetical protein [Bacteroidota bacterium]
MTDKQIQLIQSSWGHLAHRQEDLSDHFYKNLNNYLPERKADLKKIRLEKGFEKVIEAVHRLISNLPEFSKVEGEFSALVDEFARKGISKADYATALVAFLNTLEEKLAKIWTPELGECWIFTFASFHQHLSRKLYDQSLKAVI